MSKLEKFSEAEFMRDVERMGGQALKQDATLNAGIPDRLCWLPVFINDIQMGSVWFWVEWKREGAEPPRHQLAYHRKLRSQGHRVFVFDNNTIAREELRRLSRQ